MNYCSECGHALELRAFPEEGDVPHCEQCEAFRFPVFSTAISTAILNPAMDKVLLIRQTNRDDYILLAGYVKKGEDAEHTLVREVEEEVGLQLSAYEYMRSRYFARTNTLMLNFMSVATSEDVSRLNYEISKAVWFPLQEATQQIKEGSLAKTFLLAIVERIKQENVSLDGGAVKASTSACVQADVKTSTSLVLYLKTAHACLHMQYVPVAGNRMQWRNRDRINYRCRHTVASFCPNRSLDVC